MHVHGGDLKMNVLAMLAEDPQGFFGVEKHQFNRLERRLAGLDNDKRLVDTEELNTVEQLAVFLQICHVGLPCDVVSTSYQVPDAKIQAAFERVRDALLVLFDEYVKMPENLNSIDAPELLEDPQLKAWHAAMVKVVGAVAICGIGRPYTDPSDANRNCAKEYTGPQKVMFSIDLGGKFTQVYAPGYNNFIFEDRQIYNMARNAGRLPRLPNDKWFLAATPDVMFSGNQLMGAFSDAAYPTNEEELENLKPKDAHGRFNLFHSRLYHTLAIRPLTASFWDRFQIFENPNAPVSADLFKAVVVVHNFLKVEI